MGKLLATGIASSVGDTFTQQLNNDNLTEGPRLSFEVPCSAVGSPAALCNVGTVKFSTDFRSMIRTNVASRLPQFASFFFKQGNCAHLFPLKNY